MESIQIEIGRLQSTSKCHEEHISNLRKSTHDLANHSSGMNMIIEQSIHNIDKLFDLQSRSSENIDSALSKLKDDIHNSEKYLREKIYALETKSHESIIKKNIARNFICFLSKGWYKIVGFVAFIYLAFNSNNLKDLLMELVKK